MSFKEKETAVPGLSIPGEDMSQEMSSSELGHATVHVLKNLVERIRHPRVGVVGRKVSLHALARSIDPF